MQISEIRKINQNIHQSKGMIQEADSSKMKKHSRHAMKLAWVASLLWLLLIGMNLIMADPGPANSVTVINSSTRLDSPTGSAIDAVAGNVTLLIISDTRTTRRWQGYYGNISGGITLDDSADNSLYDWGLANPQGEIYASNTSSVIWTNITCFNTSEFNSSKQRINLTTLESTFGINSSDNDGINETFNSSFTGNFAVGTKTIDSNLACPTAHLYVNSAPQYQNFTEVILTDNTTSNIVFTAIIENDVVGFDGEMIVPEDGDTAGVSTYYFFVELQ